MEVILSSASNATSAFDSAPKPLSLAGLGPWLCNNCGKEFALKEYRHKHQQRCILASKRGRQSKQKSCIACAASKLGCDRKAPCGRCRLRARPCQYPSKTTSTSVTDSVSTEPQPQGYLIDEVSVDAQEWPQPAESDFRGRAEDSASWPTHLTTPSTETDAELFRLDSAPWEHISQQLVPIVDRNESSAFANHDSTDVYDPSFALDLLNPSAALTEEMTHTRPSNHPREISHSPRRINQLAEQETLHDAMAKAHATDRPTRAESATPSACPFHKITSDNALVALVRSYPRLMVRPGIYPPFVHHLLYPCATGEVAEPLAKAFCCVGAFYASLPTSRSFVCAMMDEESGRLVKSFNRDSSQSSDGEMLALVHAMCIYQMVGFFGGGDKDDVRAPGMRHSFFLKMTRLLIRKHLDEKPQEELGEEAWRRWIMAETIRRTVLLVNAINVLSCRVEKQERLFFEPLDVQIVRGMLLPAPDALWQASTAEEWAAARRRVGDGITLQQALDQIAATGRLDPPFGGLEELDGFVQLVIFTAGIERDL